MSETQLQAYLITLTVEGLAAFLLARSFGANSWRAALAAILGSAISHPIFWASYYAVLPKLGGFTVPLLEVLVVLFEALFYRLLATKSWRRALLFSAVVNFISWLTGVIVYALR